MCATSNRNGWDGMGSGMVEVKRKKDCDFNFEATWPLFEKKAFLDHVIETSRIAIANQILARLCFSHKHGDARSLSSLCALAERRQTNPIRRRTKAFSLLTLSPIFVFFAALTPTTPAQP